jgi:hypothetical protein
LTIFHSSGIVMIAREGRMKRQAAFAGILYLAAATVWAQDRGQPGAHHPAARPLADVPLHVLPPIDEAAALQEDAAREGKDAPPRFACLSR